MRVTAVKVLRPYVLEVTFQDGLTREVDVELALKGSAFEPLKDPAFFAQATVNHDIHTVVWPNGANFAPEFLRGENALEDASRIA